MEIMWSALIEKAKNNEQDAFYELYQNSYDSVYRTVKSMIKDDDTAMDIVQDTFVKGFASLSALEDPNSFLPWIKRIASNKAKDWFKKKQAIPLSQLADEEGNEPDFEDDRVENLPDEVIDRNETTRLIDEILNTLSDEQRIAVGMFYYQQMSVAEIAEELGVSENTVKSRLNYGRQKIKACVEELEKKGTKLYSLAPIPFLMYLFRNQILQATTGNAPAAVFGNIMAQGAAQAGTAAATATVAQGATAAAAGNAGGGLLATVGAKIAAGVLAVSLIGGGIGLGVHLANRSEPVSEPAEILGEVDEEPAETPLSIEDITTPISEWTDIIAIETAFVSSNYEAFTVGVRKDGTVLISSFSLPDGETDIKRYDVSGWTDIIAVSTDRYGSVVGLKSDGTVVASGVFTDPVYDVSGWTDIVAIDPVSISTIKVDGILGVKKDGTVVFAGKDPDNYLSGVTAWTDIVDIHGDMLTIGLKADGTIVCEILREKEYKIEMAEGDRKLVDYMSTLTGIVAFCGSDGSFGYGLTADGTPISIFGKPNPNNHYTTDGVSGLTDFYDYGIEQAFGLRADGTILMLGETPSYGDFGQDTMASWTDIVALNASRMFIVGLKADGTVVTVSGLLTEE